MSSTQQGPFILIGIDGGATEAKTHHVVMEGPADDRRFYLGNASASRKYDRVESFAPMDVADQLQQREAIQLTPEEREQGRLYVTAACESVIDVARQTGAGQVLIGMGMPGLKPPDGRGIDVINNGPRIPDYLDQLERGLADAGIKLAAPVARLGSDADYCGIGEEFAADGLFRDVQNAYYLGGGTGIADAMKLHGSLVPFDDTKPWLQKSWQVPSSLGPTFEKLASAKSLNTAYANLLGMSLAELVEQGRFPETEAVKGDVLSVSTLDTVARALAELIYERIHTLANGRAALAHRGQGYLDLTTDHAYRGTMWDRIIIGQRIGRVYDDSRFADVFRNKLDACLVGLIAGPGDVKFRQHYLDGDALRPGLVVASKLREAPAIGAAIDAARSASTLP